MSRHNSQPTGEPAADRVSQRERSIELDRSTDGQPQLQWVVVENPDQAVVLTSEDYILDSYFNPEYDIWEVLVRLEPADAADE